MGVVDAMPNPLDRFLLSATYIILGLNVLDVLVAPTVSGKEHQMIVLWLAVAVGMVSGVLAPVLRADRAGFAADLGTRSSRTSLGGESSSGLSHLS